MRILGGLVTIGGAVACCAVLFALVMVALVVWYWKNQPDMKASDTPPTPPIAASVEHPTAAENQAAPSAAAPVAPAATAPAPENPAPPADPPAVPPSADA
jgi:hypothetical protein